MKMTSNKNNHFGIKFLLTTFSMTLVLGFWNWFAKKDQTTYINDNNQENSVTELWDDTSLPTLVPLGWTLSNDGINSGEGLDQNFPTNIRGVTAPTPRPVVGQQQAPIVENVTIGQQQPVSPEQPRPQPTSITTTGSSK